MGGIRSLSESVVGELTLYVCEILKEEITRVVSGIPGIKVNICEYPHYCTSGYYRLHEISTFLHDHLQPGHAGLFFGDTEIPRRGLLPAGISQAGPDTCNALILPPECLMSLSASGAYVILPGWLFSWEQFVTEMGFDHRIPTTFYSSNLKEIVVLDTGIVTIPEERITSFEIFSGLPVRTVPVGLSHVSGIVHAAIYQWQISQFRIISNQEIASAVESSARQMAVFTMLSDIAQISEEEEIISRILMTCQALFAPRHVRYISILPEGPGQTISIPPAPDEETEKRFLLSTLGKEFEFTPEGTGFYVPVIHQQETLGILGVSGVSVPDRIREYLNLTLSFTRLLGLSIRNARSWHEIQLIKGALEKANIELRDNNEELLTLSEKLQLSNKELMKSQKELSESEQFLKGIVNSAFVGIAVLDPEFHILFWNPEMERMFCQSFQDIKGKRFLEIFPSLIQNERDRYLVQALSGEIVQAPDFELPAGKTGQTLCISSIFNPVYDLNQNIIGVIINLYDITKRKETERNLQRAYDAIHTAQEKLNILSSITRHDILNRVMVITVYSEMLKEKFSDEKVVKQLTSMSIAGKDIQHLIEFTREYQELGVKKPTWQQIEDIMKRRSILSMLSGITLSIQGVSAEIYVDPMLEKVLYNLVENSKRHGERVSAITITSEQRGEDLVIAYSDNGCGVASKEKELIFKQGHGKNTGMGLFLIREILGLTQITITECGVPGEGARFEMKVPKESWRNILPE
jgi:PAS domain S-box-containing protein